MHCSCATTFAVRQLERYAAVALSIFRCMQIVAALKSLHRFSLLRQMSSTGKDQASLTGGHVQYVKGVAEVRCDMCWLRVLFAMNVL